MAVRDVDHGYKAFKARMDEIADAPHVAVGVFGGQHGGISNVELALIHEFGAPSASIPERSFMRRTFDAKIADWQHLAEKLVTRIIDGKVSVVQALGLLGQRASADVKKTITAGESIPPPLKPATIAAKGSDRALVDTGQLVNSISYEYREGKSE